MNTESSRDATTAQQQDNSGHKENISPLPSFTIPSAYFTPDGTLKSDLTTAVDTKDSDGETRRIWRHEAIPLTMSPRWRTLESIMLELGHGSVECFCLTKEMTAYNDLENRFYHMFRALHKRNPDLATKLHVVQLMERVEEQFRGTYPSSVQDFRKNIGRIADFFPPDENVEMNEEETSSRSRPDLAVYHSQLKEAAELTSRVAAQRASNAGYRLLIAQLDEQMKAYTDFNEFLNQDTAAVGTVADVENQLTCLEKSTNTMQQVKAFRDRLFSTRYVVPGNRISNRQAMITGVKKISPAGRHDHLMVASNRARLSLFSNKARINLFSSSGERCSASGPL